MTAMAEYWRKRGSAFLVALAPGVIGISLTCGFGQFIYAGALPLIPFLTVGWLCSAGIYYYRNRPKRSEAPIDRKVGGEDLHEKV